MNDLKCPICGEPTKGKPFCINCWKDIVFFYEENTHLTDINQAKEYFVKIKQNIFWMDKMKNVEKACKKMYAIAMKIDYFEDIQQQKKAIQNITNIIKKKKEYINKLEKTIEKTLIEENDNYKNISIETSDYRKLYPATIRCKDGHYVRSNNEKTIDDRLYEKRVFHEYEKRYKAIDGQIYYPDFYLPDANVFIEYFGVTENKNKNENKRKLYNKDKKFKFEFITQEQSGILDDIVDDIVEKYKL